MPKKGRKNQSEQAEESGKSFQKLRHKHSAVESDINSWSITAWIDVWIKGWKDLKGIVLWGVLAANPR